MNCKIIDFNIAKNKLKNSNIKTEECSDDISKLNSLSKEKLINLFLTCDSVTSLVFDMYISLCIDTKMKSILGIDITELKPEDIVFKSERYQIIKNTLKDYFVKLVNGG